MFWERFLSLCAENKVSPTKACRDMGLSNATAVHWKKGAVPNSSTVARISKYFNVSPDFFKENEKKETSEKEQLFIQLFNDAPEEGRNYVIQVLQKLHDLREEKK